MDDTYDGQGAFSPPDLLAGLDLPRVPQQERSRRMRQKLLDAALDLFAARGYEATSIEEIAAQAESSIGSFYGYFRSKQQVLLVLMQQYLDSLTTLGLDTLDFAHDALASLEDVVHRGLGTEQAYIGAYRAWREATATDPDLRILDERIMAWMQAGTAAVIERARGSRPTRPDFDSQALAVVLTALFLQLSQQRIANRRAVVRAVARMIYHAIFPDGEGDSHPD
jgi:AcrR family transcriptional regulator